MKKIIVPILLMLIGSSLLKAQNAPVADFSCTGNTPPPPGFCCLIFSDSSSNTPTSWLYKFGDGFQDTSQNTGHCYLGTPGVFTVTLLVTNSFGSDSISKDLFIATDSSGCYCADSTTGIAINLPVSLLEILNVYPNPFSGSAIIEIDPSTLIKSGRLFFSYN